MARGAARGGGRQRRCGGVVWVGAAHNEDAVRALHSPVSLGLVLNHDLEDAGEQAQRGAVRVRVVGLKPSVREADHA